MNIKWLSTILYMKGKRIDFPENVNICLWDKVTVLLVHETVRYNIMVKKGNRWYALRGEIKNLKPIQKKV